MANSPGSRAAPLFLCTLFGRSSALWPRRTFDSLGLVLGTAADRKRGIESSRTRMEN
jgi:hypothetical protein